MINLKFVVNETVTKTSGVNKKRGTYLMAYSDVITQVFSIHHSGLLFQKNGAYSSEKYN